MMFSTSFRLRPVLVLALFTALTLLWAWPLPTVLSSRVAFDPGDPLLNTWILWWNAQAVPFSARWWSPPIFDPVPGALALSEHLAGIALFTTPLLRAGGSPALAYNSALLLSFVLSGFFTYLLVRRVTGSVPAAICAGIAFAFAPYRAEQLSHLQVLTTQWLPLQLLGLHGYLDTGRVRWLALFSAAWTLQSLSNGYYMLFAIPLIVLWVGWFVVAHRRWRAGAAIAAAWGAAWLALLPGLLEYQRIHETFGLSRSRDEMLTFSARPSSFLHAPDMLRLWPPGAARATEDHLFPGLTVLLVLAAVTVRLAMRDERPLSRTLTSTFFFYAGAALVMGALALGPATPDAGAYAWLKPYEWLIQMPGYSALRVPARFAMLMALCLAVAGGVGLAMLLPVSRRWRAAVAVAVGIGFAADGWIRPLGSSVPPGQLAFAPIPAAAVLELPPDDASVNIGAMWRSMSHGLPIVNGYSGHIPPHHEVLVRSIRRGDPSGIVELARGRTLLLVVAHRSDPAGDFRRLVESIPGVARQHGTGAGMTYLLPAQPRAQRPAGGAAYAFDVTPLPRRHVILDLGAARVVRSVEVLLRDRLRDLDGRMAIETSLDGESWATAWEDWTGGISLAAVLEDPRRAPVRFTLLDVRARYVRIHPADEWLIADLAVRGPG